MTTKNLLVELFVEELPPKALKKLCEAFVGVLFESLKAQGLAAADSVVTPFASPRRLGAHITKIASQAANKPVSQKLMPANVGLDASGQATPALLKKLTALGKDASVVSQLKRENDGKTDILFLNGITQGVALADGLTMALSDAIFNLPVPKLMTYQLADGWTTTHFVRPIHGLVALHGASIVPIKLPQRGLEAGQKTMGHRFDAKISPVDIKDADDYEAQMENEGAVIPSFEKRRAEIVRQLTEAAAKVGGGVKPIADDALLDEVTGLVERPNVLIGQFESEFLEVPQECLILTMKANQKYFPLLDANGKLTNKFLIVSNIRPEDTSLIIGGNERVVRPRLADAKFFFDQDRKKTLESRVLGLAKVVYHNKLGTQGERVQRVCAIAKAIGQQLGGNSLALQAEQAALLSKADLLTDMVGEFPELQGIMGRYYAQHDGLSDDIAYAIEDHYKPRFAGDELPRSMVGVCVALADKLETLVGMFSIGQVPTGDKDPFALRRHALGIIRMLMEKKLPLDARGLICHASACFSDGLLSNDISEVLLEYALERLKGLLEVAFAAGIHTNTISDPILDFIFDGQPRGLSLSTPYQKLIDAVLTQKPTRLDTLPKRIKAVYEFVGLPESYALAAANKRVGNILKKAEGDFSLRQAQGERLEINVALLQEPAEHALHQALSQIVPKADAAFEAGDYTASLQALSALREPVDSFFDNVMVNAEDEKLRANRLALLAQLHQAMNRVADISKLAA